MRADALSLLEAMEGQGSVVVVDAVRTGTRAGTVVRYDASHFPVQLGSRSTTHGLGVAEAIELGRSLGKLPKKIVVIGIEGACFDLGSTTSPPLEDAVDEAIQKILEEVDAGT